MGIGIGGQPCAQVDELVNAQGGGVADGACLEGAVCLGDVGDLGVFAEDRAGGGAVGLEVILVA
jgi:hypothetical protein